MAAARTMGVLSENGLRPLSRLMSAYASFLKNRRSDECFMVLLLQAYIKMMRPPSIRQVPERLRQAQVPRPAEAAAGVVPGVRNNPGA